MRILKGNFRLGFLAAVFLEIKCFAIEVMRNQDQVVAICFLELRPFFIVTIVVGREQGELPARPSHRDRIPLVPDAVFQRIGQEYPGRFPRPVDGLPIDLNAELPEPAEGVEKDGEVILLGVASATT